MDAKESDMSDTLSPSKDKSSDDTSGIILLGIFWNYWLIAAVLDFFPLFIDWFFLLFGIYTFMMLVLCLHHLKYLLFFLLDGQMDEQELNEPQNRVALIKGTFLLVH